MSLGRSMKDGLQLLSLDEKKIAKLLPKKLRKRERENEADGNEKQKLTTIYNGNQLSASWGC